MAYQTYPSAGPAPEFHHPADDTSRTLANSFGNMTNIAGALVSVALIAGVAVWGYRLMVRDVTGIPIVQATQGDMRVKPEDPGGELARHQGLAVNAVAADGNAEAPAERLILAPQPVVLTEEDQPLDDEAVAIVQQAIADQAARNQPKPEVIEAAVRAGSVEDLVEELTRGVKPLDHSLQTDDATLAEKVQPKPEPVAADLPGLKISMRPRLRPAQAPAEVVKAALVQPATTKDIDPATLAAGTRLVQLGAYDSAEVARSEWDRFVARFDDLLDGKARVVQKAQSGGRTFYRLRAHGFADLSDARRFCSALVAEGADCIPVVTR